MSLPDQVPEQRDAAPSVEELLERSAVLKSELLAFGQQRRFASQLNRRVRQAEDESGRAFALDQAGLIRVLDRFLLQHELPGGGTVAERFVAQRRPALTTAEAEMVLAWRDVVEGTFEVRSVRAGVLQAHNLIDDLPYRIRSNAGSDALRPLRPGTFVITRIVPLADDWMISGACASFPRSAAADIARAVLETVSEHSGAVLRNPALRELAWQRQGEDRDAFLAHFGADLVILPPDQAQEQLRAYHVHRREQAIAAMDAEHAARARATAPPAGTLAPLAEDLLDADSVGLLYDETEGLHFLRDFGHLDALLATPALARDRAYASRLRSYLHDDSIPPAVLRRLAARHPDTVDQVFRTVLHKPAFTWDRDGDALLRRHKPEHYARQPEPALVVIGERLAELLRQG